MTMRETVRDRLGGTMKDMKKDTMKKKNTTEDQTRGRMEDTKKGTTTHAQQKIKQGRHQKT